jgi:RNA polymerase sigma-70 factor, ECF subfamily
VTELAHEQLETSAAAEPETAPNTLAAEGTTLLYERYRQRIFVFCLSRLGNRQEADDAVQNTFLYAFGSLSRGIVPENELAWLYAIARNVCRTRQRSLWRRRRVEASVDLDTIGERVGRADERNEELIGLEEALATMPERQQQALLMREWQGLSYDEIGANLAVSQAAVETLLFRARRTLARRLEQAANGVALAFNGPFVMRLVRKLTQASPGAKTATALVAVSVGVGTGLPPLLHQDRHHVTPRTRPAHAGPVGVSVAQQHAPVFTSSRGPTRDLLAAAATQPHTRATARPKTQRLAVESTGTHAPSGAAPPAAPKSDVPQPVGRVSAPTSPSRPAAPPDSAPARPVEPSSLPSLPALPQLPPPKLPQVDPQDPVKTVTTAAQTVTQTVDQTTQTVAQTVDQTVDQVPLPPLPGILPPDGTPHLPGR